MEQPIISIIVAISRDNVIAVNGAIPWKHRSDMEHFHNTTYGKPIIMGRKTFDTIGKPLAGRKNIVLTRSIHAHPGVFYADTPERAIELADNAPEIMIIGGAEIYSMFMPRVNRMYISVMDVHVGDRAQPGVSMDTSNNLTTNSSVGLFADSSDDSCVDSSDDPIYNCTCFNYGAVTDATAWIVTEQKTFSQNAVNDHDCVMTQYDAAR